MPLINCSNSCFHIIIFFCWPSAQGHSESLSYHSSPALSTKYFSPTSITANSRSCRDGLHHFIEVFRSFSRLQGETQNNWLCSAFAVKTRGKKREVVHILPVSRPPAWWHLYKSLWNNCVLLIKWEVVCYLQLCVVEGMWEWVWSSSELQ